MSAAQIDVRARRPHSGLVRMSSNDRVQPAHIQVLVDEDGLVFAMSGSTSEWATTDIRRLVDTVDAVQAGMWQPTPALPDGAS